MKKIIFLLHLFWIVPVLAEVPIEEPEFIWNNTYQPDSLFLPQSFEIYNFNDKLYIPYLSNYINNDNKVFTSLLTVLDGNGLMLEDIAYSGTYFEKYAGVSFYNNIPKLFSVDFVSVSYGYPKSVTFNEENEIIKRNKDSINGRIRNYSSHNFIRNDTMFVFDKDRFSDSIFIRIYDMNVNLIDKIYIDTTGFDNLFYVYGWPSSFIKTSDGGYVIPFDKRSLTFDDKSIYHILTKINSDGKLEWTQRYIVSNYDTTEVYNMIPFKDNSFLVTALSRNGKNRLYTTTKMNKDGEIIWRNEIEIDVYTYKNPYAEEDKNLYIQGIKNVFLLFDEKLIVLSGYIKETIPDKTEEGADTLLLGKQNNWLHYIDRNGNSIKTIMWENIGSWDGVSGVCESSDGNLFVAGANSLSDFYVAKIKVDPATSVEDNYTQETTFLIHPNPASDYIEISYGSYSVNNGLQPIVHGGEFEIYDLLGNVVYSTKDNALRQAQQPRSRSVGVDNDGSFSGYFDVSTTLNDLYAQQPLRIDISHLPRGVYFVRLGNKVEKFVKK